jgi:hypothetical protein
MNRCPVWLVFLLLSSCSLYPQTQTTAQANAFAPNSAVAANDEAVSLVIENQGKAKMSEALIQRIFRETVREVAGQLNPEHPPHILAKVTLRLGAAGFTVETLEGKERRTIICMREWDEFIFARMVARAARNGLFSDQELDKHARSALVRARAVTSVTELRGH